MPVRLGDSTPAKFYLGDTAVAKLYLGDTLLYPSVSPMGMDKSGTFAMVSNTTAKITGWAARSGFPNTSIVSDGLVANGAASVTINWKVTLTGNWPASTGLQIQLRKNGTTIATTTIPFNTTTATFNPVTTTLAANDRLELWYVTPFGNTATIQQGSTATFLYYNIN